MIIDNAPEFPHRDLTESEQLEFYRKRYGPMVKQINAQKARIKGYEVSIKKLSIAVGKARREEGRDTLLNLVEVAEEVVCIHGS